MRIAVYLALAALVVLHQDFWLWDDASLWFGFLPAGLGYHMAYTLAASALWAAAAKWAWPRRPEQMLDGDEEDEVR